MIARQQTVRLKVRVHRNAGALDKRAQLGARIALPRARSDHHDRSLRRGE
jgi:hypothetical protein